MPAAIMVVHPITCKSACKQSCAFYPWATRCWQVLGDKLGIPAVVTAMMGLSTLLLTGVLTWKDCLVYSSAWDTLFWFASEPAG